MNLDRESFDFRYVSDEIMSNLSFAQDYPTVFTYNGHFPACYIFLLNFYLARYFCMFLSSVHIFQNYPSFEANSFRNSISIKKYELRSGPSFCWA